jgi:hypothetical protein
MFFHFRGERSGIGRMRNKYYLVEVCAMERSFVVQSGLIGLWLVLIIGLFYAFASDSSDLFQLLAVIAIILAFLPLTLRSGLDLR